MPRRYPCDIIDGYIDVLIGIIGGVEEDLRVLNIRSVGTPKSLKDGRRKWDTESMFDIFVIFTCTRPYTVIIKNKPLAFYVGNILADSCNISGATDDSGIIKVGSGLEKKSCFSV